jgi:hypothetical protein
MVHSRIIEAVRVVGTVTGKEARVVGASIFVDGDITYDEADIIRERILPRKIEPNVEVGDKTRIDL